MHLTDLLLELTQKPNELTELLGGLLLLATLSELGHLGLETIDHLIHLGILRWRSYILILRLWSGLRRGWLRHDLGWLRHDLRWRWLLLLLLLLIQQLANAL